MEQKGTIKSLNIKTNMILNLMIQILTYAVPLITIPYLSRVLTPTGIGNYSYANSIVQYLVMVVSFGFVDYGTKKIAQTRENKDEFQDVVWGIFWVRLFLCLFLCLIFYISLLFYDYGLEDKILFFILSTNVFSTVLTLNYFYKGMENYRFLSIAQLLGKIVSLFCIFIFVKSIDDLYIYAIINVIVNALIVVSLWLIASKTIGKIRFQFKVIINCLKEGFLFFLPTIATSLFTIVDITILGAICSKEEVAFYDQASKIQTMISQLIIAVCPIMISRMAILRKNNNVD